MGNSKSKNSVLGYVFAGLVVVALVLVIVGMCINVIKMTASGSVGGAGKTSEEFIKLFDDGWADLKKAEIADNTFLIISFIVTIAGAAVLLVDAVLHLFVGKDIKIIRYVGVAVTFVGAVLILVAGLTLASTFTKNAGASLGGSIVKAEIKYTASIGVWLGFIGGLVGAIAGALPIFVKK